MKKEEETEVASPEPEEEVPDFDHVDPLKRDPEDDSLPGLDPVVSPVPPE